MRKTLLAGSLLAFAGASVVPLAQSGASATTAHRAATLTAVSSAGARSAAVPRFYTPKVRPNYNVTGPTVKFFKATAKTGSTTYNLKMIGTFPGDSAHPTATIPVKIIPLALQFADRSVDPTATLPSCAGGGTAVARTTNSGLFKNINTTLGPNRTNHAYQFLEAFRRDEFWFQSGGPSSSNPNYSLRLAATVLPKTTVGVTGGAHSVTENCGFGGNITISSFDSYVRGTLIPNYVSRGLLKSTDLAYVLTSNIVLCGSTSASSCGIGGYHSAYQRNGVTQTYGTGYFATNQRFSAFKDTSIASHELSEWEDDPFVDNATPPWGHIGQVSGCQGNFETGDPLTGTLFNLTTTTGTHFNVQDLAAISWFYRFSPSLNADRKYSFFGKFTSPAAACH